MFDNVTQGVDNEDDIDDGGDFLSELACRMNLTRLREAVVSLGKKIALEAQTVNLDRKACTIARQLVKLNAQLIARRFEIGNSPQELDALRSRVVDDLEEFAVFFDRRGLFHDDTIALGRQSGYCVCGRAALLFQLAYTTERLFELASDLCKRRGIAVGGSRGLETRGEIVNRVHSSPN
ncbi:hypothetical protein JCM8115_005962 [Rhodotorula mucilaginosa]